MTVLGVSGDQKSLIKSSWAPVPDNMEAVGKVLFKLMFERFPNYEDFFAKYKAEGALLENQGFLKHVQTNVMKSFDDVINNLENEEAIQKKLYDPGKRHIQRNLTRPIFHSVTSLVIDTLKQHHGSNFTDSHEAAWKLLLDNCMDIMSDGLEQK